MNYKNTLIIPAVKEEERLTRKIAGMNWLERVVNIALRAGITTVAVCVSPSYSPDGFRFPQKITVRFLNSPAELAACSTGRLVIMSPSALPDTAFLKTLLNMPEQGQAVMPEENLDLLSVYGNLPVSAMPGFFMDDAMVKIRQGIKMDFRADIMAVGHGTAITVPDGDISTVEERLFNALVKETEGFMSRHFERKISIAISKRLIDTPVTPNQMTIFSVLVGLTGACFISMGGVTWQALGALMFLAHSILDGCDGEIARIKFMESRFGGILDFWGDNIVHGAVFSAIAYAWYDHSPGMLPVILGFLAVSGTFLSAGMVYFKTMVRKKDDGPLYTSVSESQKDSAVVKVADYLSRRDFIYLVVILAFAGHLDWFLFMTAIGSPGFFILLLVLNRNGRK